MSKFVATVKLTVEAHDTTSAEYRVRTAIQAGTREGVIDGGQLIGTPEECVCLTASELDARVKAAVEAARTAPVTT